jgi:hypothetical protein
MAKTGMLARRTAGQVVRLDRTLCLAGFPLKSILLPGLRI